MKRYIWISVILVVFITGCKGPDSIHKIGKGKSLTSVEAFNYALNKEYTYDVTIKYTASLKTDKLKHNVGGNIKILNDSVLWMNMVSRAMGIEIARILCTKDSLFFIDRMNKYYYEGDYSYLSKRIGFNVDMEIMKGLLTGFLVDYSFDYESNYNQFIEMEKDSSYQYFYRIDTLNSDVSVNVKYPEISHKFNLSKSGNLLLSDYTNINSGNKLFLNYGSYSNGLPTTINVNIKTAKTNGVVEFNYKDINQEVKSISYTVPKNYLKIQ